MPRAQGCAEAAYNPSAFPPSRQLLLHCSTFRHPCRSPGGQKEEVRVQGKDCSDVHGCTNAAGAGMRRSGLQSSCISAIPTIAPALFYLPTSLSVAWRSEGGGRFYRGELGRAPQAGCYFLDQLPQPAPGLFHALRPAESILRSPLPTWSPPTLGLAVSV